MWFRAQHLCILCCLFFLVVSSSWLIGWGRKALVCALRMVLHNTEKPTGVLVCWCAAAYQPCQESSRKTMPHGGLPKSQRAKQVISVSTLSRLRMTRTDLHSLMGGSYRFVRLLRDSPGEGSGDWYQGGGRERYTYDPLSIFCEIFGFPNVTNLEVSETLHRPNNASPGA